MKSLKTKQARHNTIIKLVQKKRIENQAQLLNELSDLGLRITQATLSRDLDELNISKVIDSAGQPKFTRRGAIDQPWRQIASSLIVGIDASANIVVVKTPPGAAQFFASSVDHSENEEIIGTIAGDDTVLLVTKNPNGSKAVSEKLWQLVENNG